jgi:hypothetical protein
MSIFGDAVVPRGRKASGSTVFGLLTGSYKANEHLSQAHHRKRNDRSVYVTADALNPSILTFKLSQRTSVQG